MSSHKDNAHPEEKPVTSMDEKRARSPKEPSLSDPEAPNDSEEWRHGIDSVHEKRILRKLDIHLLPFVSLLYLLSFLSVGPSSLLYIG